jgi:hypothetical protein
MGKAADNERIKLQASWYNNLSVATVVASIAIPSWSIPAIIDWSAGWRGWEASSPHDRQHLLALLIGFVGAGVFARICRVRADNLMATIKD